MKFTEFKTAFFKGVNKRSLLATVKNSLSFVELKKFVDRFQRELPSHKTLLNVNLYGAYNLPKDYKDLNRGSQQFNTRSLEHELGWQAVGFVHQADLLKKFLTLRASFEHNLLIGNYTTARENLLSIESEICVSYWSIENRFILDENEFGSEKNWVTRNLIMREENENDVRILGDFYSVKCESKYAFYQFNEHYLGWENFVDKEVGLLPEVREYFRFKGNYLLNDTYNHLEYLIYRESKASLIDRYIMFIRVVHNIIISQSAAPSYLKGILISVLDNIPDSEIKSVVSLLDGNVSSIETHDAIIMSAIDKYSAGNYIEAQKDLFRLLISNQANNIELLVIYNKCILEQNLPYVPLTENATIVDKISYLFYEILSKNLDSDKAYFDLIKLSYIFNNSHIGLKTYAFVQDQLGWRTNIDFSLLSNLSSKFLNPITCNRIHKKSNYLTNFLKNLSSLYDDSLTVNLYTVLYNSVSESIILKAIPEIKEILYKARTFVFNENYEKAIPEYAQLVKRTDLSIINKHEVLSNLYMCYLLTNNFRDCLKIFVNAFLEKKQLTKKMDYDFLLNVIIEGKFKNVDLDSTLVELPIFFNINSKDTLRIKQSYEKFLLANNCNTPSQLIERKRSHEVNTFVYFLKNVCVPDIMMLSRYLSSTYHVNVERIKICQYLALIDPENIDIYNEEIAVITQKNAISKVIGRIDEGKIYVNDEKLKQFFLTSETRSEVAKLNKSTTEKRLSRELFFRTIELQKFTKHYEYKQLNFIYAKLDNSGNLTFNSNPVFSAFKQMFLEIRDNFIDNNEYGLNPYLSTRIRHGTLPNHIRSVFERLNLVTAQNDGVYGENEFWKEKFDFDSSTNSIFQELLADFSKEIDEISATIKDEWIQCRTEGKNDKPFGLFDFSYGNDTDLLPLYISEFFTYEEFIDYSFNELWSRTEKCLQKIRYMFNNDIKTEFTSLITDLEQKLEDNSGSYEIYGLKNNVNLARTEIQTLLSNIAKWFQRSESSYDGEYQLSMLTETSVQITKNINHSYNFEIEIDVDTSIFFKGEYHQHIIDIIRNCLENMIKRSSLPINLLKPFLSISEFDGLLKMTFVNNVAQTVSANELMTKLNNIKNTWLESDQNVGQEDGTGFPKIKKILHSDLDRKNTDFSYSFNDDRLALTIAFETKGLKI